MADDGTRCSGTDIMAGEVFECDPLGVGDSYTVRVRQVVGISSPGTSASATPRRRRPTGPVVPTDPVACSGLNGGTPAVTETAPTDAFAGDNITWTITVTNDGPADMEGPYDSDDLADQAVLTGHHRRPAHGGRFDHAATRVRQQRERDADVRSARLRRLVHFPVDHGDRPGRARYGHLGRGVRDLEVPLDTAQIGDTSPEWSDNCATAVAISSFPRLHRPQRQPRQRRPRRQ